MAKSVTVAFRVSAAEFNQAREEATKRGFKNPNELARHYFSSVLAGYSPLQMAQDMGQLHRDLSRQMQTLTSKQETNAAGLCDILQASNDSKDQTFETYRAS